MVCLLRSGKKEGEDGGEECMGERVEDFFHSLQNEKIWGIDVDYCIFTKIFFCIHFITIYKIKYYINLFIIYNFKNI